MWRRKQAIQRLLSKLCKMKLEAVKSFRRASSILMVNSKASSFRSTVSCICDPHLTAGHRQLEQCQQHSTSFWVDSTLGVKKDDLFWCFRHFMRFGKLFGVVPFDGVFTGGLEDLKLRWTSPGTMYSIAIMLLMLFNMIIGFLGLMHAAGNNATEWAWSAESFVFYSMAFFIHIYFLKCGQKLISLFRKWATINLEFSLEDKKLSNDTNLLAGLIFTSAILENFLLQIIFFFIPADDTLRKNPPLLRYYKKAQTHWSVFINYHEALPILIFFCNKFSLYAWNFVDILIIVMSRALYHKFKSLHEVGKQKLLNLALPNFHGSESIYKIEERSLMWNKLVKEYDILFCLLKTFEDFLSPLIFASYAINCFYTCLQLHLGLSVREENNSPAQTAYMIWSFVHLVVRMFLVSLNAARINDHVKDFLELLYLCPEQYETRQVERTRFKISSIHTGLTGLRCFVITRPFILKVISVIFTIEIVLLQAPGPASLNRNGTIAGRTAFPISG